MRCFQEDRMLEKREGTKVSGEAMETWRRTEEGGVERGMKGEQRGYFTRLLSYNSVQKNH